MINRKIVKGAIYSIGFIGLSLGVYSAAIYNSFPTSSSSPVIQTGEVIPFDFKGKIIYLTEAKLDNYHYILYGAVGFFLTYIALYLIFLRKKDKG